jgi:fructokinase
MKYPIVCFGEVLWDILPSGKVPGGAPMNVTYHLNKLGRPATLITRVGIDEEGRKLIEAMEKKSIPVDNFQLDYEFETGKVNAAFTKNNDVIYDIKQSVAYDNIQWEDSFESIASESRFFIFGSLAARSEVNRKTLDRLLDHSGCKVLDINLRAPHYNRTTLELLLHRTDILKLNKAELELITGWFTQYDSETDRLKMLQDKFNIPQIIVTKGENGAVYLLNDVIHEHSGFVVKVSDTVGSGDAFLSGFISKLMDQAAPDEILEFACRMGALVAGQSGACPEYNLDEIGLVGNNTHSVKEIS